VCRRSHVLIVFALQLIHLVLHVDLDSKHFGLMLLEPVCAGSFKVATKILYIYCTQLVSTIKACHHVSKCSVRPAFYFGGLKPRALGIDHTIDAVPKSRLGDGCARGRGQFEGQVVRGLIPRTSL
jgi:hypothetical protein